MAAAPSQTVQRQLWATCLWPGLPQICLRGAWSGLVLAVGFTLLVDLLLASSLIWTELVSPTYRQMGWLVLLLFWVSSALGSWAWLATQEPALRETKTLDAFTSAQQAYLRGHWPEAELQLRKLLEQDDRDADALLLLATLLRRTDRARDCRAWLDRLSRLDEAEKWSFEIAAERALLAEEVSSDSAADTQSTNVAASESAP